MKPFARGYPFYAVVLAAILSLFVLPLSSTVQSAPAAATVLFSDNFEDGVADGWTKSGGTWSVITDGSRVYSQSSTSSDTRSVAGSAAWTEQAVEARVKPMSFNGTNRYVAILARYTGSSSYYYLALRNTNRLELGRRGSSGLTALASAPLTVSTGTWYTLRLEVKGAALTGLVNGAPLVSAVDSTFASGKIGLATLNTSARFDNLLVTTVDTPTPTPTRTPGGPTATPTRTPTQGPTPTPPADLIGFASVNALGQNGTTGGAGGPTVTVSTAAEFLDYIGRPGPYVIQVNGMLTLPGPMHDVTSDKTIIGIGASSGITGAGLNIGLPVDNAMTQPPPNAVHNVIIRNMIFTNAVDDSINIQMFSHHIWVDHNDFSDGFDGLLDIKRGSDYVTVSWNHFHHHAKTCLLGHDDNNGAQDIGRLRVTYHHNWFDNTSQRNPRVRFAEPVHVFNNYFIHNSDYGVASAENAGIVVEGNYFENVEEPTVTSKFGTGRLVARNNIFAGEEAGQPETNGTVVEPGTYYQYTVDNPMDIPTIIRNGVGVGKIN